MEIPIPPVLQPGERIHYPIFHDECCIHANDQCTFVWAREGEQPLRNKSRGRIVHVSDFIIEHCGRLVLWQFEQEAQEMLPKAPLRPVPDVPAAAPSATAAPSTSTSTENPTTSVTSGPIIPAAKKAAPKKAVPKKKAAVKNVPATRCTLEHADTWVPPPPPAPFTSYQIPSFDACCIIYPGANYDRWWDMPQLIAQVNNITLFVSKTADIFNRRRMLSRFSMSSTLTV
jgi:hypothetical protein